MLGHLHLVLVPWAQQLRHLHHALLARQLQRAPAVPVPGHEVFSCWHVSCLF